MARKGRLGSYLLAGIIAALSIQFSLAGNTTCVNNQGNLLSWYTSVVGETPCMTYQRLRQICNNKYQVPVFSSTTPGDRCDDQLSACCCNTIAYHLSMLCMVCQQDSTSNGIDAVTGTYDVYLKGCSPIANKTLPTGIQSAVCNQNIRIDNFLYDLNWPTGDWFYVYAEETAGADHAANNNNTFTRCQNEVVSLPTSLSPSPTFKSTPLQSTTPLSEVSSPLPTPSELSDRKSRSSSNTPVIGGVIGGLLFLAVAVLAVVIWRKRRRNHQGLEGDSNMYETSATSAPANRLIPNRLVPEGRTASAVSYSYGTSTPSQSAGASTEPAFRHNDGGPALMPGLAHHNPGDLPPAYDPSWDSDRERSRRSLLGAGSVSIPPSNFVNSDFSDEKLA